MSCSVLLVCVCVCVKFRELRRQDHERVHRIISFYILRFVETNLSAGAPGSRDVTGRSRLGLLRLSDRWCEISPNAL